MRAEWALVACALVAPVLSGCAKPKAEMRPELPPLAAPAPPPRMLPPLEGARIEGAEPATTEPSTRARTPPRRTEAPRNGEGATRPDGRTEPPAVQALPEPPAPADEAHAAGAPVPSLQLTPGAGGPASEPAIRRQLSDASRNLLNVDYTALNSDARTQYDTAKRFMILADQAIRDGNLIFAQTLADKAGTIASVLSR